MEERFVIKRKDFKKLERYAENIYNTAVVIDYFCYKDLSDGNNERYCPICGTDNTIPKCSLILFYY